VPAASTASHQHAECRSAAGQPGRQVHGADAARHFLQVTRSTTPASGRDPAGQWTRSRWAVLLAQALPGAASKPASQQASQSASQPVWQRAYSDAARQLHHCSSVTCHCHGLCMTMSCGHLHPHQHLPKIQLHWPTRGDCQRPALRLPGQWLHRPHTPHLHTVTVYMPCLSFRDMPLAA
jgi:hypothetical protein